MKADRNPVGLLIVVLFALLIGAVRIWQTPVHSDSIEFAAVEQRAIVAPANSDTVSTSVEFLGNQSSDLTVPTTEASQAAVDLGSLSAAGLGELGVKPTQPTDQTLDLKAIELYLSDFVAPAKAPLNSALSEMANRMPVSEVTPELVSPQNPVPPLATLTPMPPTDSAQAPPTPNTISAVDRSRQIDPGLLRILMNDQPDIVVPMDPVDSLPPEAIPSTIEKIQVPAPIVSSKALDTAWPVSEFLIAEIKSITAAPGAPWQRQALAWLSTVKQTQSSNRNQLRRAAQQLDRLSRLAEPVAQQTQRVNPADALTIRTAGYALARRSQLWHAILNATSPKATARCEQFVRQDHAANMQAALRQMTGTLNRSQHRDAWSEFLQMKEISAVASSSAVQNPSARLAIASSVLDRILNEDLSDAQKSFLNQPAIRQLKNVMYMWCTNRIDETGLLRVIEQLEADPNASNSQMAAQYWQQLKYSAIPEHRQIANVIDQHYRNANVRFAATEEFLNRLVPAIQNIRAPVREVILGAQVQGQSDSRTQLKLDLLPDDEKIKLRLDAQGRMNARTRSSKGAVTVHSRNIADVLVRKPLSIACDRIRIGRSDAVADGRSNTIGLDTQYDRFPIVGGIVRRVALQKHFESKNIARRVFEMKVEDRARESLDQQVNEQLAKAQQQFKQRVMEPLDAMELEPTALAMRSTNQRMEMRGRLAAEHQMGAFSARPRPLPNNMVDLQIHESALNNFLDQVQLEGREGTVKDVFQSIAVDLGFGDFEMPEEVPEDVQIKLASVEPIRVECDDNRVKLTIRVAQLKGGRRSLRNFEVVSYYSPETDGIKCDLRRDGSIHIKCRPRDRMFVLPIFTKVLSKNRTIPMVLPEVAEHPKMQGMQLTQLVMRDGWLGVSVGAAPSVQQAAQHQTKRR